MFVPMKDIRSYMCLFQVTLASRNFEYGFDGSDNVVTLRLPFFHDTFTIPLAYDLSRESAREEKFYRLHDYCALVTNDLDSHSFQSKHTYQVAQRFIPMGTQSKL